MGNKSASNKGPRESQRSRDTRNLAEYIKSEKFYTLAAELYPGSFRPTPTHSFIKVLESQGLLHTCFTQNIDTLERRAGVSASKIVEAHGSFATQHCLDCKAPFDDDEMREIVLGERAPGEPVRIPRCKNTKCGGLVKPDIVFFGEALPDRFINSISAISEADLLLIIGTSLTVHPFASLADMADRHSCRRVLINLERVGGIGRRPSDLAIVGECDAIIRELCAELGWHEYLEAAWAETTLPPKPSVKKKEVAKVAEEANAQGRENQLEAELAKVTEAIGKQLNLDSDTTDDSEEAVEVKGRELAQPRAANLETSIAKADRGDRL
ncbi:hypothetical protein DXG03_004624 [Asterophora parasitica]|uniref:Deacetylase sirtuin-type domain-containing protein n=1 Tax=Asterophora parasitica TaxID=117018 RepID=A0A9P7G8I4_9AGAR|nr:hypothetical protein DXG03_004624 [Asterophora parasitica]